MMIIITCRVLTSVKHLLTEAEYEAVVKAVAKFQNEEGPQLQAFLRQR